MPTHPSHSSHPSHSWAVTPKEAIRIQNELIRPAVRIEPLRLPVRRIAGADAAFDKAERKAFAGCVVWDLIEKRAIEEVGAAAPLEFPYVPGLLTFREGPALLTAFEKLSARPDVLMFDGAGFGHPRRCGIASHLGVLLDVPSIGAAKSRLCGQAGEPGRVRGSTADLIDRDELIGRVVRTRDGIKPLYISVGRRVTLDDAVRLTLTCCVKYRLPEPTRLAHQFVSRFKHHS